ncbi:MAG TPA: hypothetical protein VM510_01240 [Caulifigura sp.]|jgi:hypothetical protein|nr:hypothetical protein [Caulifigura sp.]
MSHHLGNGRPGEYSPARTQPPTITAVGRECLCAQQRPRGQNGVGFLSKKNTIFSRNRQVDAHGASR